MTDLPETVEAVADPSVGASFGPGSREPSPAVSALPGFDPSRVRDCEFPGSYSGCARCEPCLAIHARRAKRAAPFTHLIARQSSRQCRICQRVERYCQTDGQGRGRHPFSPRLTCESCVHMGRRYWGDDDYPKHICGKGAERRTASFRTTGDFAEDFMQEFRKIYDAGPKQSADDCRFFEPRDRDEHPKGEDATRLSGEAMPARVEGIAQAPSGDPRK